MVFKATKDNGGVKDPSIGPGRPKNSDKKEPVTRRSIRDKELLQLVRKLKPNIAAAIKSAVDIMGDAESTDTNKLKAAAFLFVQYKELLKDLYEGEEDPDKDAAPEEVQPQQQSCHVLSLVMPPVTKE